MIIKIDIWGPKNHGPPVELGYLDFRRVWKLNIKYKCWAIEIERQPFLHQNTKAIFLLIRIVCVFDFIFSFSAIILEKGQLLYLTITNDVKMFFCFVYQMWDVCNNCCSTVILVRYLLSFLSIGKVIVAKFYPFFRVFRVRGPFITSRTIVREVMMGPRTRNTRKNG